MKISESPATLTPGVQGGPRPRAAESAGTGASPAAHARVAFSAKALRLAAQAADAGGEEARVKRIVDLKQAIESGAYEADSREVAKKMLQKNFLDLIA